ncbi:MAG: 3-oxoacyl-ACP synthase III family protein [Bacillota bacterium]
MKKIGLYEIGTFVPETKLTNKDLEKMVDTTDDWITSRTGIKERRIAPPEMHASEMAFYAARNCLEKAKKNPDLLISSTASAEKRCPYQASIVANRLELKNLAAFDLNAVCSGSIYGLAVASSMMQTYNYKNALVTASEKMTMLTDYKDRASCILFGDGASAILLSSEDPEHEILDVELGIDASGSDLVSMGGPGDEFYFRQDGQNVYKFVVSKMNELIDLFKKRLGLCDGEKFYVVPHQANKRMLESVAKNKNIPPERMICNIEKYGNTSSASIGLALSEAWGEGRFVKGDILFLIGFGGGLSWAGAAVRW